MFLFPDRKESRAAFAARFSGYAKRLFPNFSAHAFEHGLSMFTTQEPSLPVGKYLVSPMVQRNVAGHYTASVSIRNGSHDRVFRFVPDFTCYDSAVAYAIAEGHDWIKQTSHAA